MPDREKVIKGLECCTRYEVGKQLNNCLDCPYVEPIGFNQFRCKSQEMKEDALALLKEQEDLGKELENAIELIHKKNARIEILNTVLDEQPQIVRCGECKHKYYELSDGRIVFTHIDREGNDEHGADWFCADGERQETE